MLPTEYLGQVDIVVQPYFNDITIDDIICGGALCLKGQGLKGLEAATDTEPLLVVLPQTYGCRIFGALLYLDDTVTVTDLIAANNILPALATILAAI